MEKIREEKLEINMDNMDDVFDKMLDAQCEELKKQKEEYNNSKTATKEKSGVIDMLNKFKSYIQSRRFNSMCKTKSKDAGVKDYKIIKNAYVTGFLGKIADVLNLTIRITADAILYAVEFLSKLVNVALDFTTNICSKLINLFTLNCSETI